LVLLTVMGPERYTTASIKGDDSAIGRILAWQAGLKMFEESPVIGVGYKEFPKRHVLTAHNSFMLALAESGFLGAMAWVGLNYWALLTLARAHAARSKALGPPGS